jgi:hypothetical protein
VNLALIEAFQNRLFCFLYVAVLLHRLIEIAMEMLLGGEYEKVEVEQEGEAGTRMCGRYGDCFFVIEHPAL